MCNELKYFEYFQIQFLLKTVENTKILANKHVNLQVKLELKLSFAPKYDEKIRSVVTKI